MVSCLVLVYGMMKKGSTGSTKQNLRLSPKSSLTIMCCCGTLNNFIIVNFFFFFSAAHRIPIVCETRNKYMIINS